ncbi:hypothetical protein PM082_023014 [Marasmius tenuissimus]|nr:hypothetical protein PM082_023014 [Marasmius tenuissimus]
MYTSALSARSLPNVYENPGLSTVSALRGMTSSTSQPSRLIFSTSDMKYPRLEFCIRAITPNRPGLLANPLVVSRITVVLDPNLRNAYAERRISLSALMKPEHLLLGEYGVAIIYVSFISVVAVHQSLTSTRSLPGRRHRHVLVRCLRNNQKISSARRCSFVLGSDLSMISGLDSICMTELRILLFGRSVLVLGSRRRRYPFSAVDRVLDELTSCTR